ncbi:carbon-nitrogen hydrolase family protein [Polynucleobacter sp. MWH-Svant-W18]|uniref:carbon-nitrogen hydrolase family protein n=1 Tax=Polynucleobacter sp. MWH-Svant-W18 TaxID=1855909 RepID=UPI001BFE3ABC|nr:carbon-nitrogen hydrolase family protein [Polynucleobacter sp. MWH-Svant-W18]QWD78708.1 carbon-nitrogen hydrolase family protein [Polynucleobacter sp. MWH-Svant-W18]
MKKIFLLLFLLITISFSAIHAAEIKVAAVEFNPVEQNLQGNIDAIVAKVTAASQNGAQLIVLPEVAATGWIIASKNDSDTIPGKATAAMEKITKKYNNYVVVGLYENDPITGLTHNAAALIGPKGYIGKYRKNQIPEGDFNTAAPGNLGFPVFDTDIGRIGILICFDDSRLQSLLIPSLRGADILAMPIGSDTTPKFEKMSNGNHSTIANIATLSPWIGINTVATNQAGLVKIPKLNFVDQFTGGSSIWSATGKQLASSKAGTWTKPEEPTIIYAKIDTSKKSEQKEFWLKHRRPELYGIYNLYKAPVDPVANNTQNQIAALLLQYESINGDVDANAKKVDSLIKANPNGFNLAVLPFNSFLGKVTLDKNNIAKYAETLDGKSASLASTLAKNYSTYLLFSMPEVNNGKYYETAVLFDFNGKQAGIYRKSHLNDSERQWAIAGNDLPVFNTNDLGRLAVMLNDEVRIPELTEIYALNRADLILIPAMYDGKSYGGEVNIPKGLVPEASNRGMYMWYDIAKYSQAYTLVANYLPKETNGFNASALYSLVPEGGYYPPNIAPNKEAAYQVSFTTHLQNNLWIDQQKLVVGRRYELAVPLTLDSQGACLKEWRKDSTNREACPKVASGK